MKVLLEKDKIQENDSQVRIHKSSHLLTISGTFLATLHYVPGPGGARFY